MSLFRKPGVEPKSLDLTKVQIEPFDTRAHVTNRFDCGARPLNLFLKNKAGKASKRLEHSVMVATLQGSPNCIGYYALQVGSDAIPEAYKKATGDYINTYAAFPAINLSFLAVDEPYQGQSLGKFLLQDVFTVVSDLASYVGLYALTVQSYDRASTEFYRKIGFTEYSEGGGQPKMLYPLRSIRKLLGH